MTSRRGIAVLALVAATLPFAPVAAATSPFVSAAGASLLVDGKPWTAIGVNVWDMDVGKALANDPAGCYYQRADIDGYLDRTFSFLATHTRATAVRTFGFQVPYTGGGTDWSSTDKLLYYAAKHGLRVIPVLGNQYAICGSVAKPAEWYRTGYRVPEAAWGIDYRSYVIAVAARYRNDPRIAFWQLMNEADPSRGGSDPAPDALESFTADMVRAIREEAGDTNHLINLGTTGGGALGNRMPGWARLVDCPGGCSDVAEVHVYDVTEALPGAPLASSVDARMIVSNAAGERNEQLLARPVIDGWTRYSTTPPGRSQTNQPYTAWTLRLTAPAAGAWTASIDAIQVQTTAGVRTYSFETGTDGFSSPHATVRRWTRRATDGQASLEVAVPAGRSTVDIVAPPLDGQPVAIALSAHLNFRAPAPDEASTIASNLHAVTASRGKPLFVGEAGIRAAVPGLARCASYRTPEARAAALDAFARTVLDDEHRAAGVLVWDFKDPQEPVVRRDGSLVADPSYDCWSVGPGDPALGVLRALAGERPADPPALGTLPPETPALVVYQRPPSRAVAGTTVPIRARVTRGGDPMPGWRVVASGACSGASLSDHLGTVELACATNAGSTAVSVSVDPSSCGCSVAARTFPLDVRYALGIVAKAGAAEAGGSAPVSVTVQHPAGGSLQGVAWSLAGCGTSGTIAGAASTATITTSCPLPQTTSGPLSLAFMTTETPSLWGADAPFTLVAFERLYHDPVTGDCVGISVASGWVGMTERAGTCSPTWRGSASEWLVTQVPAADRRTAFVGAPDAVLVNAALAPTTRIEGVFSTRDRAFTAALARGGTVRIARAS